MAGKGTLACIFGAKFEKSYNFNNFLDKFLKGPLITNLDALRAANTNSANFVLDEITDTCERFFQRFGLGSNGSGYLFEKNVIRSNGSGYPFEKEMSSLRTTQAIRSNGLSYPFKIIVSCATVPNYFHPSRL